MANKLLSLINLNSKEREISKAGIYDESGNLTEDGQELLLSLVAKDYEDKLYDLAKDFNKTKKSKKSDDNYDMKSLIYRLF